MDKKRVLGSVGGQPSVKDFNVKWTCVFMEKEVSDVLSVMSMLAQGIVCTWLYAQILPIYLVFSLAYCFPFLCHKPSK